MLRSRCSPLAVYPLDLLCQREPIASDLLIRASYVRIAGLRRATIGGALFVGNRQLVLTCENFLPAELPPELPPNGSL
jgi:hypothetical protein